MHAFQLSAPWILRLVTRGCSLPHVCPMALELLLHVCFIIYYLFFLRRARAGEFLKHPVQVLLTVLLHPRPAYGVFPLISWRLIRTVVQYFTPMAGSGDSTPKSHEIKTAATPRFSAVARCVLFLPLSGACSFFSLSLFGR